MHTASFAWYNDKEIEVLEDTCEFHTAALTWCIDIFLIIAAIQIYAYAIMHTNVYRCGI